MQKIAALLIVGILAAAVYLFWSADQTKPDAQVEPPIDSATLAAAKEHIATLTGDSAKEPIDIAAADNFVTSEQLIALPAAASSAASIESAPADGASTATSFGVDLGLIGTTSDISRIEMPELNRLRLKELLNDPNRNPSDVFYIHAVDHYDRQGLWGIMQRGLTETFAKGIRLGQQSRTLSATIPEDADERLADSSSSFLGHILDRKVKETLVYNYRQGLLGRDPNMIQPGQQLLIIRFSEQELIGIYNHFANRAPITE